MILRLVSGLAMLAAAGCAPDAGPSVDLRRLATGPGGVLAIELSTDRLDRPAAQDLLLLATALGVRDAGHDRFQFLTVDAQGLADGFTGAIRYFDVGARVSPLARGETGDPARKSYEAVALIRLLGAEYAPLLPPRLAALLSSDGA